MSQSLRLEIDPRGIARLTLNRPDKRNALSADLIDALHASALSLGADPTVRCVILAGEGKSFCAGGDLAWMLAQIEADRTTRLAEARRLALMLKALNEMPKPLIARVHGDAYGGGLGLLCVADGVVACQSAKFGLTETRLGLIPATIGPYVVARLGEGMARRIFMSARRFSAEEGLRLGLIGEAVPDTDLDHAVAAQVEPYLACAPQAVGEAKRLARALGPVIDETVIEETIARLADIWEGPEARAGIEAFLARRPPPWA
ncbi:MAG: crotonase/enoyl-CoA hydratase family protein [Pseudomonadota bacterium]